MCVKTFVDWVIYFLIFFSLWSFLDHLGNLLRVTGVLEGEGRFFYQPVKITFLIHRGVGPVKNDTGRDP